MSMLTMCRREFKQLFDSTCGSVRGPGLGRGAGRAASGLLVVVLAGLLPGCAARGPADDPISRNLTWFDYVGGGDIERSCLPASRTRHRWVYNAQWGEQVRSYDLVASATGEGAILDIRVFAGPPLADLNLGRGLASLSGRTERQRLSQAEYRDLLRALDAAPAATARPGDFLRSDGFYWVAASCVDGRFVFRAWDGEAAGFAELPFGPALAAFDRTGVPLRPWRRLALGPFRGDGADGKGSYDTPAQAFRLQLGANGLRTGPGS